ncbi:MAG: hypothetical protein AAGC72_13200 [Planctomycetota bacterium]
MRQSTRLIVNSAVTYGRMLVTVGIGLLVTRLLLQTLGVSEFGLLMALGASAVLLSVIRTALTTSGTRHLAYEIGRGDTKALQQVFASSLVVHLIMAVGFLLLGVALMPAIIAVAEIPADREVAAWWVLGSTLAGVIVAILMAPFYAINTAYQEIPIRTVFELLSRLLTLAVVILLQVVSTDLLATYAVMSLVAIIVLESVFVVVCMWRYPVCRQGIAGANRSSARDLVSFGGWSVLGSMSVRIRMQGMIFLMNVLFGASVNAAYAIAVRAVGYQSQLIWAMLGAIKPAITTAYGKSGQSQAVVDLVHATNRFSVYLSLMIFIPIFFEAQLIIQLWLGDTPPFTPLFVRIAMATSLVTIASQGYSMLMSARGQVRGITLISVSFQIGAVGIGWVGELIFKTGPEGFIWSIFVVSCVWSATRVIFVTKVAGLTVTDYLRCSLLRIIAVCAAAYASGATIHYTLEPGYRRVGFVTLAAGLCTCITIWVLGLTEDERNHFRRVASKLLPYIK